MRKSSLKRGRRRTLTAEEREQAAAFKASVWGQPCTVCRGLDAIGTQAHHVVEAAELGRRGLPVYDVRNVLPLCRGCHERHTNASRRVPFRKLQAANIDYAYEVLGPFAADYIRARYPMDETEEQT